MRERVDATCELDAHAHFSILEASKIGEREGARGVSTGRKDRARKERKRCEMRKMVVEEETEREREREREREPQERTCGKVIRTGESFIVLFIPSHTITLMTRSKRDSRGTFIPRPPLFLTCFHSPSLPGNGNYDGGRR